MNSPLISEYIEAVMSAGDNFNELSNLRPVLDDDGQPVMSSGNFAVVFKMRDEQTGKLYAVKCFLKEQEGRAEAYRLIAEELEFVKSTFLTPIKYVDKELHVDTKVSDEIEFPVLLMDWIEGIALDKYICEHLDNQYSLSLLAYQFSHLAMWLIPQPFVHGDLQPNNILVRNDGTLVLVDYDDMYVPPMKGQKVRELGSPYFRHPARTENDFDEHIDDFPLVSMLLCIKAIALDSEILQNFGTPEQLFRSMNDYNIGRNPLLSAIFPSESDEINKLVGVFIEVYHKKRLSPISLNMLLLKKPAEKYDNNSFDTLKSETIVDEYGIYYSKDKKMLIGAKEDWLLDRVYRIPDGTEEIFNHAFVRYENENWYEYDYLEVIVIPPSVKKIGNNAIPGKYKIKCNSPYFKWYNEGLYTSDFRRLVYYPYKTETHEIMLHPFTETISFGFSDISGWGNSENECSWQTTYYPTTILHLSNPKCKLKLPEKSLLCIPKGMTDLFINAGYEKSIIIEGDVYIDEQGVVYSNDRKELVAFPLYNYIEGYSVLDTCESIRERAFSKVLSEVYDIYQVRFKGNHLCTLVLPESLRTIGDWAFFNCNNLYFIFIPQNVSKIGRGAFEGCCNVSSIVVDIRNKVYDSRDNCNAIIEKSTNKLIYGCSSSIIPYSVTTIGQSAFGEIKELSEITIPRSVHTIEKYAFYGCKRLASINMENGLTSISDGAFWGCEALTEVTIPESVKSIGSNIFQGCYSLESIIVDEKNDFFDSRDNCNAIIETKSNTIIAGCATTFIPSSVEKIGQRAFSECCGLTSITIPEGVSEIGKEAFESCTNLESITLPDSLMSIGNRAFDFCNKLETIIIPENARDRFLKILPQSYHDKITEKASAITENPSADDLPFDDDLPF